MVVLGYIYSWHDAVIHLWSLFKSNMIYVTCMRYMVRVTFLQKCFEIPLCIYHFQIHLSSSYICKLDVSATCLRYPVKFPVKGSVLKMFVNFHFEFPVFTVPWFKLFRTTSCSYLSELQCWNYVFNFHLINTCHYYV